MRVISGFLKGREIKGYNIEGTRPTMDRVKESVFSTIQNDIKDSIVLDLFAGSGNLGIEAISNGAKCCYFIDNNKIAIKTLKDNIKKFNIEKYCNVILSDYNDILNNFKNNNINFDIIFIDPPYKYNIMDELINKINNFNILNNNALLVIETQNNNLLENYENISLLKKKKYSDKYVYIYRKIIDN